MSKMDAFEMFRTGCNFSDCADLCLKEQDRAPESNLAYITPAIVNAAFSCEVFLKLLLQHEGKDIHKIHKLNDLYAKLSEDIQMELKEKTILRYGKWSDIWERPYLEQISNAFVEWRYSYEHDWTKSANMQIEVGFLIAFKNSLKEFYVAVFGETKQYEEAEL